MVAGGDKLVLEGMRFFGHHGDVDAERELGSHVYVDVELSADFSAAGYSDVLGDTLDYVRVYGIVRDVVEGRQYRLLEAIAEGIAAALLQEPRADSVRVRVAKQPPIDGYIERCAVIIERARVAGP
ncbi:MAG TPA: dihydroneopterin aldolase [Candidatus Dormibacteraeota bacterium]